MSNLHISGNMTDFEKSQIKQVLGSYDPKNKKHRKQLKDWGIQSPIKKGSRKKIILKEVVFNDDHTGHGKLDVETWTIRDGDEFARWNFAKEVEFSFKCIAE